MNKDMYCTTGWKKFELNRRKILLNYELAKFENEDRPMLTEHGVLAEASLRAWLSNFLPNRYGVTAGYIIPHTLQPDDYKQYHYDIIVYDKLDSPVIWVGDNADNTQNGQDKAIPSSRVLAVFEVKANWTKKSAFAAREKLNELNEIRAHLPRNFFKGVIFMEVKSKCEKKVDFLQNLIEDSYSKTLDCGCVLSMEDNSEISSFISSFSGRNQNIKNSIDLYADLDAVNNSNYAIFDYCDLNNNISQHFYRRVLCSIGSKGKGNCNGLTVEWSRNGFSMFVNDILSRLAKGRAYGRTSKGGYPFGFIFDKKESK